LAGNVVFLSLIVLDRFGSNPILSSKNLIYNWAKNNIDYVLGSNS